MAIAAMDPLDPLTYGVSQKLMVEIFAYYVNQIMVDAQPVSCRNVAPILEAFLLTLYEAGEQELAVATLNAFLAQPILGKCPFLVRINMPKTKYPNLKGDFICKVKQDLADKPGQVAIGRKKRKACSPCAPYMRLASSFALSITMLTMACNTPAPAALEVSAEALAIAVVKNSCVFSSAIAGAFANVSNPSDIIAATLLKVNLARDSSPAAAGLGVAFTDAQVSGRWEHMPPVSCCHLIVRASNTRRCSAPDCCAGSLSECSRSLQAISMSY